MPKKAKVYNRDYKLAICRMVAEKKLKVPRMENLHLNMVYRWLAEYEKHGEAAFVGKGHLKPEATVEREIRRLRQENEDLRMENEILKKRNYSLSASRYPLVVIRYPVNIDVRLDLC